MPQTHDTVLVLDFGAQYSQLIARRVRDLGVYSTIVPFTTKAEAIKSVHPVGLILSGGPASVDEEGAPHPDPEIFKLGIPILGICYGLQVMTWTLGGHVASARKKEYGLAGLHITDASG